MTTRLHHLFACLHISQDTLNINLSNIYSPVVIHIQLVYFFSSSAFLFLRLICPAVLNPKLCNLLDGKFVKQFFSLKLFHFFSYQMLLFTTSYDPLYLATFTTSLEFECQENVAVWPLLIQNLLLFSKAFPQHSIRNDQLSKKANV